jgi:heptosyltransferase-2
MKRIKARMKKLDRMAAKRDPDQDAVYAEMDSIRAKMSEVEAQTASLEHPSTRTKFLTQEHYPKLTASPRQQSAASALLQKLGVELRGQPLVALNAGATNSRAKCWPAERFAALADRLIEAFDAHIVLVGAAPERETAQAVADGMLHRGAINLAGETTMTELVGLLDACHLLVSNDTGPAHIAAALGRPTLTIFGPTNEFETAPTGRFSELIRADGIECARCMHRDCPIDHRCMTQISAEQVFDRARALLEETRS